MARLTTAFIGACLAFGVSGASATILIDNFSTVQGPVTLTATAQNGMTTSTTADGAGIIGGERDVEVFLVGGPNGNRITVVVASYNHSQDGGITGSSTAVWDGNDNTGAVVDHTGLGGVDLTNGGLDDALEVVVGQADLNTTVTFEVFTDAANSSTVTLNLVGGALNDDFVMPYASFVTNLGAGADFTDVGAITMLIDGTTVPSLDVLINLVQTTNILTLSKTDAHFVDVNFDGNVDVGDTLQYTVTINNPDDDGNQSAAGVMFTDTPGANSALVVGSVTTSLGSVTTGNTGGDTSVVVNVGSIPDGGSVTITFNVTVTGFPLVCNQGFVYTVQPTDDPATGSPDDPTCTTIAFCGDGIVNDPTEECDDGDMSNNNACLNSCQNAECGDGFVYTGVEECDDANMDNTDSCLNTCVDAECGDGFVQAGVEECDDANMDNTDSCLNTCVDAECGDGFVQAGVEECDDGDMDNTDACLNTCQNAECGDGFVQTGVEECDDGDMDNTDACLNTCQNAECGDGFVQTGVEECDDGDMDNTDACLNTCQIAECGDGFVQTGVEECDDGDMDNTDACLNTCQNAECGDGFVQAGVEECDDGNASNTDACLNTCQNAECGDGFVQTGVEQCDDGDLMSGDGCSATCTLEGSCCLPSGVCVTVTSSACSGMGGTPSAPGTICAPVRACCDAAGACENLSPTCCALSGGTSAIGPCQGDTNMNGSDDACDDLGGRNGVVPTVSSWGMIVLSILLLSGLMINVGRRSAATAY